MQHGAALSPLRCHTVSAGVWAAPDHQAIAWCNQLARRLGALALQLAALPGPHGALALAEAVLLRGMHPRLVNRSEWGPAPAFSVTPCPTSPRHAATGLR